MAYDASNNPENDQQVVSSTPLSGGSAGGTSPSETSPEAQNAPSQPSTVQAGMSSAEAGSQGSQAPQKANKPASSGMFTNIQKYVQKNKPQAQKMAGAATQNVAGQASEIAEQATKKKEQMDATLAANQKSMETQKDWAAGQVSGIMGTAPTPVQQPEAQHTAPVATPEQNQEKFQAMMGGAQGLTDVGTLNIGKESQKARALQQLAGGMNTEQGRRNLLKDTFQKQGEYTRGMGGLDNLIVSGDQGARESMIQGAKDISTGLQDTLQDTSSQSNIARLAQEKARQDFGGQVGALAQTEADKFSGLGDEISGLKATDAAIQGLGITGEEQSKLDESALNLKTKEDKLDTILNRSYYGTELRNYKDMLSRGEITGHGRNNMTDQELINKLTGELNIKYGVNDLRSEIEQISQDNYQMNQDYQNRLAESKALQTGEYVDQLGTTQSSIDKFNALQGLLGKNNTYDINDLLDRYDSAPEGAEVRTSDATGGVRK